MASAGRTLLPRFSGSIVMSFKARRRAMTSETFLWLSRAACRWRSATFEQRYDAVMEWEDGGGLRRWEEAERTGWRFY